MDAVVLQDFTSGKTTRKGRPLPEVRRHPVVTAVHPAAAQELTGARSRAELLAFLRRLRDEGRLVASPGRLQHKVRGLGVSRAYVFVGDSVPRVRPRGGRVGYW